MAESSGLVAADSSGNGHTGAYAASGVTYGLTGPVPGDTAVAFDGVAGCITSSFTPVATSGFTVVAWFQGIPGNWAPVLVSTADTYHSGNGLNLLIGTLGGQCLLQGQGWNNGVQPPTPAIYLPTALAGWHMVTWKAPVVVAMGSSPCLSGEMTFDGVVLSVESSYATGRYTPSGNPLLIGAPYGMDSFADIITGQFLFFDGVILTDQQIANLYGSA
jgi:hypothetical protein